MTLRNPDNWKFGTLAITITNHAVERMAQRQANAYMEPMKGVVEFFFNGKTEGTWEVGCSTGMAIVTIEGAKHTVITFVDAAKLGPEQPTTLGEWRRIDGQEMAA